MSFSSPPAVVSPHPSVITWRWPCSVRPSRLKCYDPPDHGGLHHQVSRALGRGGWFYHHNVTTLHFHCHFSYPLTFPRYTSTKQKPQPNKWTATTKNLLSSPVCKNFVILAFKLHAYFGWNKYLWHPFPLLRQLEQIRASEQNHLLQLLLLSSPPCSGQFAVSVKSALLKMLSPYSEVWVYLPFLQSCLCSRSFLGPSVCRFPIKFTSHHVTHWLFFIRKTSSEHKCPFMSISTL